MASWRNVLVGVRCFGARFLRTFLNSFDADRAGAIVAGDGSAGGASEVAGFGFGAIGRCLVNCFGAAVTLEDGPVAL